MFIFASLIYIFSACKSQSKTGPATQVNPFIGTGGHGHTYPGAVVPFGMVQLSPDTKIDDWDHCSGYHYSDSVILGFSHTHLSGTGIGDYGDIRFMPVTGSVKTEPGTQNNPDAGYASRFKHSNEFAEPGYYSVLLDDYQIKVELTATERTGLQRYTFQKKGDAHVIIDLKEAVTTEKILGSQIKILDDHTICGYRRTDGWANDHWVFFYSVFSEPLKNIRIVKDGKYIDGKEVTGVNLKVVADFEPEESSVLLVKTGISAVDIEGAKKNLLTEINDWDFERVRNEAFEKWNRQLSKIEVKGGAEDRQTIFYTALYHTMLAPNIYSDVDFRFRGHDQKIHQDSSFTMYTVFSIWDTFRALHPLFTIIERERSLDLIKSMLAMYDADKHLPVWELAANETWCMIGYNSVSVIADAYRKGITGFDAKKALRAMVETAESNRLGLKYYKTKGYIPADKESESVSKTLEYAYDDWCIAQMADMTGNKSVYKTFIRRAQYYKNLFDKKTGFFRAKTNGAFMKPFDPKQVNFTLTEANTWQYNFFVPQDVNTLIKMLGGDDGFNKKLDQLFSEDSKTTGRQQADITGLIGQYAHGNEPSHHIAYLYNFSGEPWKTQKMVNKIMDEMYHNAPDGLAGNEDCGQMSAWYVMSAMGFYSVTPGSDEYVIGSPLFPEMTLHLENGKTLNLKAQNRDDAHFYVSELTINGQHTKKSYLTHEQLMAGGEIIFKMAGQPDESFGRQAVDRPVSVIKDYPIVPVPYFEYERKIFKDRLKVALDDLDAHAELYYRKGNRKWKKYEEPVWVKRSGDYYAKAVIKGEASLIEKATFKKIPGNRKITLKTKYSKQYTAGGDDALINTVRGGKDFRTGNWQGYHGNDIIAVVDLGRKQKIHKIGMGFLQDQNAWIFMPLWMSVEISSDGKHFTPAGKVVNKVSPKTKGVVVKDFVLKDLNVKARYIKIHAKNRGTCPKWHKGYPGKAWIFADEIWVD